MSGEPRAWVVRLGAYLRIFGTDPATLPHLERMAKEREDELARVAREDRAAEVRLRGEPHIEALEREADT